MNEIALTPNGHARLTRELDYLEREGRLDVAERLAEALATDPDLGENRDYLDLYEELGRVERRIALLREQLAAARIVEPSGAEDVAEVGTRVVLRELRSGRTQTYELVGPLEGDAATRRITTASPVGAAVLGRRRGDRVRVEAPKGPLRFEIVRVLAPEPAPAPV